MLATLFVDLGPGLHRDHPPRGRRLAGIAAGPLALLGSACLSTVMPAPLFFTLVAPFAIGAVAYAACWGFRVRSWVRREVGWEATVVNGVALLLMMTLAGPRHWSGGIVMGVYGGSAALLGSFTVTALGALPKDEQQTPYGVPARMAASGVGLTALACLDMLPGLSGHPPLRLALVWAGLSLVAPLVLIAAGHRLFPRYQAAIWSVAVVSALGGQAAIQGVLLLYPAVLISGL